jgi:hypothetical protein
MAQEVAFYRSVLRALQKVDLPFLIGGYYAMARHTLIDRPTKDLDLMIRRADWPAAARALRAAGIYARLTFPHWLGKALGGPAPVDIIFNGGNALTPVDASWFARGIRARVLGFDVKLAAPEELLWSKAFVMERERFDGADVLHLILKAGRTFDWNHLCDRFRGHERVLLAHLILFGYAYPDETSIVPRAILQQLAAAPNPRSPRNVRLCRGTLLSREQYLVDIEQWGYQDARLAPLGNMSARERTLWRRAIHSKTLKPERVPA